MMPSAEPLTPRSKPRATALRRSALILIATGALVSLGAAPSAAASDGRGDGRADGRRPTVGSRHAGPSSGRVGRFHGGHRSRGFHRGFYHRPSFYSTWYWPGAFYRPYPAYAYYDGYYGGYGAYYRPDSGALDLDIRPEKASIYLDGELIGVADNYDGWPRYLWLREGTYRLVAYKEGYETLAREVRIRPGEIISLKDRMQPGVSKSPEELFAQAERTRPPAARRAPADDRRDRQREPSRAPDVPERDWRQRERTPSPPIAPDQRSDPARLRLFVGPADAVVYLDGRLLGSGEELSRLHSDLIVDPGTHRIEVIRPGYETYSVELELTAGEDRELRAELEPKG
ncbi:MAG TPA: PEGA domain-containing protein [Thermoanaerobaculia bacterium]|nr:PEGA domain-containing protein [Thermoanaerobaculia bacterium]